MNFKSKFLLVGQSWIDQIFLIRENRISLKRKKNRTESNFRMAFLTLNQKFKWLKKGKFWSVILRKSMKNSFLLNSSHDFDIF